MGGWPVGVKSPKLFSEVICTANIQKCPETYNTCMYYTFQDISYKGSIPLKKTEFYEKVSQNGDPPPRTAFMKSLFRNLTVFLVHMYF